MLLYSSLGKIRVKIVTSKDALESMDGKNDGKLLSEREETQFKDMILSLLVSNASDLMPRAPGSGFEL